MPEHSEPNQIQEMADLQSGVTEPEDVRAATERRVRRLAQRQGLTLTKSRRRSPEAPDYGTYGLIEQTNDSGHWRSRHVFMGDPNTGYGFTLAEIEQVLLKEASTR